MGLQPPTQLNGRAEGGGGAPHQWPNGDKGAGGEQQPEEERMELGEHISCHLCGNFLSDAVTLTGCLHFFCRHCLLKHLAASANSSTNADRCPKCFVQLGPNKPFFRSDLALQELVYKLVPDLFWRRLRRIARSRSSLHKKSLPSERRLQQHQRLIQLSTQICSPNEKISIRVDFVSLSEVLTANRRQQQEPFFDSMAAMTKASTSSELPQAIKEGEQQPHQKAITTQFFHRFFRCPAKVRIEHLKRLLELKLTMTDSYGVYFMDNELRNVLEDDYTLEDLVHLYNWNRESPLQIRFTLARPPHEEEDRPPILEEMPQLEVEGEPLAVEKAKSRAELPVAIDEQLGVRIETNNVEGKGMRKTPPKETKVPSPSLIHQLASSGSSSIPPVDHIAPEQSTVASPFISSTCTIVNNTNTSTHNQNIVANGNKNGARRQQQSTTEMTDGPPKKRRKPSAPKKEEAPKEQKEPKVRKKPVKKDEKTKSIDPDREEREKAHLMNGTKAEIGLEKDKKSANEEAQQNETNVVATSDDQRKQPPQTNKNEGENTSKLGIDARQELNLNGTAIMQQQLPVMTMAASTSQQRPQKQTAVPKTSSTSENKRSKQQSNQKDPCRPPPPPPSHHPAYQQQLQQHSIPMPSNNSPPTGMPSGGMFPSHMAAFPSQAAAAAAYPFLQNLFQNGAAMTDAFNAALATALLQQQQQHSSAAAAAMMNSQQRQQISQMFEGMATTMAGGRKALPTQQPKAPAVNNNNKVPHGGSGGSPLKTPRGRDRPSMVGQAPTSSKHLVDSLRAPIAATIPGHSHLNDVGGSPPSARPVAVPPTAYPNRTAGSTNQQRQQQQKTTWPTSAQQQQLPIQPPVSSHPQQPPAMFGEQQATSNRIVAAALLKATMPG